jgi:hypothetical protein
MQATPLGGLPTLRGLCASFLFHSKAELLHPMPRAYVDDAFNWQHAAFAIFKRSVHSGFSHLAPKGEVFGYKKSS